MAPRRLKPQPASVSRAARPAWGHGAATCDPSATINTSIAGGQDNEKPAPGGAGLKTGAAHESVEGHTQAEVDDVLLPPGGEPSHAALVHVAHAAVHVVHDRSERHVPADPDVVARAGREPPTGPVEGGAGIHVIVGEAEATREEEAALGFGVEIHRGGDIRHRLGVAGPIGMSPDVDCPAEEDVAAGRAAELHEPGDTTHAGAVDALVALDVRRAIAQPETDPKAIASLRVLRPRRR